MLPPDVLEDFFYTFVVPITVSGIVVLWGLVLLRLFEFLNGLLLGLQYSGFPRGSLMLNDFKEFILNCFHLLLQTYNFATHGVIVTLDGLEVLLLFL